MSVQLPDWQPFVNAANTWIPDASEGGSVVAVLAPARATGESWAAGLAFELASRWADEGHRVVLADVALEHPSLHEQAGFANEEGVSDAARFGSSVSRIARAVPQRPFFLITAGSPTADEAGVAASPRWARLVSGFREAGVTLVLFLREESSGLEAFMGAAKDVIVLRTSGEPSTSLSEPFQSRVRAVMGPDGEVGSRLAESATADMVPINGMVAPEDEPDSGYAPRGGTERARSGQDPDARRRLLWIALGVLVLVLLVVFGALRAG